ncbi:Gfo/Idh/MocA family oxidoreductase [Streptomyces sp. H10-C2]|uniref:Gfo/Idh/MocA family protein n=1 Tax=unclassified Streptomyces TaxID=2593676 RepID=UPI0024BA9D99|nr:MULTISPECIES: Gfo/Idh/MocA family oxidoreductase [unclassified Streptomyces]MDJ0341223.1 Gfo/Idh/MocA family oxidoreductase [Streptomyces sp. PH10-H1]MDJ0369424.1 Gfo/Idh/MocA family oxidoreductase [Streptomyces sp. H10-C2]
MTFRVGLLGTGPWAAIAHAPALSGHPDVEFTGVWGRRPEAAAELAAGFGTRAYDDVDALIADVDAVAIALPPDVQAPLAARAAAAGRHLLLDKPLAATVGEARAVVEAADRAGVASVVFFTVRFDRTTGEWVDEQAAAGGWFTGRADWLGSVFPGGDSPFAASPWRREKGALWDVGPHALSVLLPVFGEVTEVAAISGSGDTVNLALRHANGVSSTATLSLTAPEPAAGVTVELRGERGVTRLPELGDGPVEALRRAIDALITAARTGRAHPCDAHFALRVTETLARVEDALGRS